MHVRRRLITSLWIMCIVVALLCASGAVPGNRISLELGIGDGSHMLFLCAWGGTMYVAVERESVWAWFELKWSDRSPIGARRWGFRWRWGSISDVDPVVGVPLWLVAIISGWIAWRLWKRVAPLTGRCRTCGYDMRATPLRCPEW